MPNAVSRGRELASPTAARIQARGHEAVDARSVNMGAADDSVIASHARQNGFCLLTRDKDFGDIRNYPPADYAGIVVLDLPDETVANDVLKILGSFLSRKEWLDHLQGRLAIVQPGRVRFRPA
jgi:predicted nuclease of predicted toxin-antitoxin system